MILKIKDITGTPRAISAIDGDTVYEKIVFAFSQEEQITLDFEGIELTITAFLNSAIGKLYGSYDNEVIKNNLKIVNFSEDELPLLKLVVDRAKIRFGQSNTESNQPNEA